MTSTPVERRTEILPLGDAGAAVTVFLPATSGRRPVTMISAPYCNGAVLRPDDKRLIEAALKAGSAVAIQPLPCGGAPLSFGDFEKGMAKIRAEGARLNLDLDAMTIVGASVGGS